MAVTYKCQDCQGVITATNKLQGAEPKCPICGSNNLIYWENQQVEQSREQIGTNAAIQDADKSIEDKSAVEKPVQRNLKLHCIYCLKPLVIDEAVPGNEIECAHCSKIFIISNEFSPCYPDNNKLFSLPSPHNQIDPTIPKPSEGAIIATRFAAILIIITACIWGLIALYQFVLFADNSQPQSALFSGWNLVIAIVRIIIALGILRFQYWGYSWGVGTAALSVFLNIIQYTSGYAKSPILIFMIPLELAVFFILIANRKYFHKKELQYSGENT
jgi:hypothetical protein